MSEEVTYADLNFQNASKTENIQEHDKHVKKEPPAPSCIEYKTTLTLTLLCLLLLIGLGILGSMFHITLKTERGKLKELQRNISLQLINSSKKIGNLSIKVQKLATKLCHELHNKDPEHRCKPCPANWMWYKESCFSQVFDYGTWERSEMLCSAQNASLLKIKNKSILEFVKSYTLNNHWLGLSPRKDFKDPESVDEKIISSTWFTGNMDNLNKIYCGYLSKNWVYYGNCNEIKSIMCEKTANPVKVEDMLLSEVPEGSM